MTDDPFPTPPHVIAQADQTFAETLEALRKAGMNERACFAIWAWNPDNPEEFYEHTRIGRVYTEEGAAFWSQVVEAAMKAGLAWADFVGEKMKEWRDGKEE